jgi:PadR family transcriptional regulator PadR
MIMRSRRLRVSRPSPTTPASAIAVPITRSVSTAIWVGVFIPSRARGEKSAGCDYAGPIRLRVLHHAVQEPIYGLAMIEELGRHGYKLSAGTVYPILHGMEEKGYLISSEERSGSTARRVYRATPAGMRALAAAKIKVRELFGELFDEARDGSGFLSPRARCSVHAVLLIRHSD